MIWQLRFTKPFESHILFSVYKEGIGKLVCGKHLVYCRKRTAEILVRFFNVYKRGILGHMLADRVCYGNSVADYNACGKSESLKVSYKLVYRDVFVGKVFAGIWVVERITSVFEKLQRVGVVCAYRYVCVRIFWRKAVYVISFLMKFLTRKIYKIGRVVEVVGKIAR